MSWSIGYDNNWQRDIGYGVTAFCDSPGCHGKIDRGLAYVCGGEPYGGERGCGLYFCINHGGGSLCARCRSSKPPYKRPKADHHEWLSWKLVHPSWEKFRCDNPEWMAANDTPANRAVGAVLLKENE